MHKLTDSELLEELKRRFEENKKSLHELRKLMKQLEMLNKKLKESEALKTNFLSNIRNEINNPLTSIMGLSENLLTIEQPNWEKVRSIASMILAESSNLDFQLKNIFAAAELEAGEASPNISKVDIDLLIRSIIDSFKNKIDEKELTVNFSNEITIQPGTNFLFQTDAEKLHLAILNLLSNAIEYCHRSTRLEVRVWLNRGYLNISVKNFGIMISKRDREAIFDRFKQLDAGITKSHRGHGLGLSITKAIIDLLNGKIFVSSAENRGSIFTISIPEAESYKKVEVFASDGNELFFAKEEVF